MSRFLNTKGNTHLTIGICQRCQFKFPIGELFDDRNIPGMKVCAKDRDLFDPYRLPARMPDRVVSPFVRPDERLTAGPNQPADWQVDPDPVEPFPKDTPG